MPETKDGGWILDDGELDINRYSSVCFDCAHLVNNRTRECKAFKSIPVEIWNGRNNHTQPYPGDGGIRFKLREKEEGK